MERTFRAQFEYSGNELRDLLCKDFLLLYGAENFSHVS